MTYAVTTTHHASAERQSRADRVALRCGVPRIPRQSTLPGTFELAGVDVLYVVAQSRDVLVHRSGESITITPGLLKTRLHNGLKHPYIRAIAPDGVLPDVVFDGTLGLALDALHLAGLGVRIEGSEASPAVYSLLEEGLPRLARGPEPAASAAARIHPTAGRAAEILSAWGPDSVDVVVLSPMFASPRKAPPGYAVFREVAVSDPLGLDTVEAARAAARRRVVLKLRRDEPAPESWPAGDALIVGRAVEYRILQC